MDRLSFDARGNLPPGVHELRIGELGEFFSWTPRRRRLFRGVRAALGNLAGAGVRRVWVDGSFVTAKDDPNDVDGCWEYDPAETDVDRLDPVFLDFDPPRDAMKRKYGVDFFIKGMRLADSDAPVEEFFQLDRDGNRKGIIIVELRSHD